MSQTEEDGRKTDIEIRNDDAYRSKIFKYLLIGGLFFFNSAFAVFFVMLFMNNNQANETTRKPTFIKLEIICWIAGIISTILLLTAIAYTVCKLKKMFPGHKFPEQNRITCIAIIFSVSIFTKSLYEWIMYFEHTNSN